MRYANRGGRDFGSLPKHKGKKKRHDLHARHAQRQRVVVVVCGVGKVNAAMCAVTLINRYAPELVINSGVAGALSPLVSIGDMVIATKTVEHDMNTTALGDKQGEISFPDGKVIFFECDKAASRLLEKVCAEIPDTKTVRGIMPAAIFSFRPHKAPADKRPLRSFCLRDGGRGDRTCMLLLQCAVCHSSRHFR